MAMTSSPWSVSSFAMIEPVQPRPTMTTSLCGSLRAMSARLRCPVGTAGDGDGRQREAFVMPVDPVEVIVAGAGEADHLPGDHVAVAAVDRVGKEALLDVLERLLEESLAVGAFQLGLAAFEPLEQFVLVVVGQLREMLAALVSRAIAIKRGQPVAVCFGDVAFRLRAEVLGRRHEGRAVVMSGIVAVGAGELTVEIDGAAGILAARRCGIGGDDAVGNRLDSAAFIAVEKMPGTGLDDGRRIAGVGFPGQRPPGRRGRCLPANRVVAKTLENRRTRADPGSPTSQFLQCSARPPATDA